MISVSQQERIGIKLHLPSLYEHAFIHPPHLSLLPSLNTYPLLSLLFLSYLFSLVLYIASAVCWLLAGCIELLHVPVFFLWLHHKRNVILRQKNVSSFKLHRVLTTSDSDTMLTYLTCMLEYDTELVNGVLCWVYEQKTQENVSCRMKA